MEALITVNGVAFPDPVTYKPDVEAIGVWERNANGDLVGDLVAYKVKLNLQWGMLSAEHFKLLLSAVFPFFVSVRYYDARTADYSVGEFYASPRSGSMALRKEDEVWWKEVAFNLVER